MDKSFGKLPVTIDGDDYGKEFGARKKKLMFILQKDEPQLLLPGKNGHLLTLRCGSCFFFFFKNKVYFTRKILVI